MRNVHATLLLCFYWGVFKVPRRSKSVINADNLKDDAIGNFGQSSHSGWSSGLGQTSQWRHGTCPQKKILQPIDDDKYLPSSRQLYMPATALKISMKRINKILVLITSDNIYNDGKRQNMVASCGTQSISCVDVNHGSGFSYLHEKSVQVWNQNFLMVVWIQFAWRK